MLTRFGILKFWCSFLNVLWDSITKSVAIKKQENSKCKNKSTKT